MKMKHTDDGDDAVRLTRWVKSLPHDVELYVVMRHNQFRAFLDETRVITKDTRRAVIGFGASPSVALSELAHRLSGKALIVHTRTVINDKGVKRKFFKEVTAPRRLIAEGWLSRD